MDEILEAVDEILADVELSRSYINRLRKFRDKLEKALNEARALLRSDNSVNAAEKVFEQSITETLENAPEIYQEEVQKATSINEEYAYPLLKRPLLELADINGLFRYTVNGVGWHKVITVDLDMDGVAGSIHDYAAAVTLARGALGVGQVKNAAKASATWRTKIYGSKLYTRTMKMRAGYYPAPAPYWSLLNDGNTKVSMSSDRGGGTPYPVGGPTRFVQKTEERIANYFRLVFSERQAQQLEMIVTLKEQIVAAMDKISRMDDLLQQLEENFDRAKTISRQLGTSIEDIDAQRLLEVSEAVRSGSTQQKRFRIGGGVRVSASKIAAIDY
jgi:hypothetical protein